MSRVVWIALGCLAYVIFLLANLPASQVIGRLSLPQDISFTGINGTIWDGRIDSAVVQGIPIKNAKWQLDALPLLWGSISIHLDVGNHREADDISAFGPLTISALNTDNISAENLHVYVPVEMLIARLPLPLPVRASGRLHVNLTELEIDGQCQTVIGSGSWLNAQVSGTQGMIDFGQYNAQLDCESGAFVVMLDGNNRLALEARAVVSDINNISVSGRFKPDPQFPQEVHQAATFFGQTDADGYYTVKL
ncbi:type II secretion system protein N [Aestuariibacter salexigens]|uniref:type II secretion system protein N n=1 Tax=Aestuariibacter salexigens TaxID=226010 RepID=UPI000407A631|nr:type II secretion system protein N [Aestuariibacter salexigens]